MRTRAKIFIADCTIGAVIGALLGVFVGITTESTIIGWLVTDALIGITISGSIGSIMEAHSKSNRILGSMDDGAGLGFLTGLIAGYIGLTAGWLTSGSMTVKQFVDNGCFIGFLFAALVIGLLSILIGTFINGAIARLGNN